MEIDNRPVAIFNCGPIAAGKSRSTSYYIESGLDQGVVLNFDALAKENYDRIKSESKHLSHHEIFELSQSAASANRNDIFDNCIKNKHNFTYENCLSDHAFDRIKQAKAAGFKIEVYLTFQTSLTAHFKTESLRRLKGVDSGAVFETNDEAIKNVSKTYFDCIDKMEAVSKLADKSKIFENHVNGLAPGPVFNIAVLKDGMYEKVPLKRNASKLREITNPDVKQAVDDINAKAQGQKQDMEKELFVIGGAHGSGKSTYSRAYVHDHIHIFDADKELKLLKHRYPDSNENKLQNMVLDSFQNSYKEAIAQNKSFAFESNLQSPETFNIVNQFKEQGYKTHLYYIGLENPELCFFRVKMRVDKGLHNVEEHLVNDSFSKSTQNLDNSVKLFDKVSLIDNSELNTINTPTVFAEFDQSKLVNLQKDHVPAWATSNIPSIQAEIQKQQTKEFMPLPPQQIQSTNQGMSINK